MNKYFKQCYTVAGLLLVTATLGHATDVNVQAVQGNQPIETQDAKLKINVNPQQALPPGSYTFELVVVDDSGNQSTPARARVTVRDNRAPTAVLKAPQSVDVGKAIVLDASSSSDVGGNISKYVWRLVSN